MHVHRKLQVAALAAPLVVLMGACASISKVTAANPTPATVWGRLVRANDGTPVTFANILVVGTRIGTLSDETGAFRLSGLPAGRVVLRIQALGDPALLDTLDLAHGDSLERLVRLRSPREEHFLHIRDSLTARGHWPPSLDSTLEARMRGAQVIQVFRLDPDRDWPPSRDTLRHVSGWPIVGRVPHPSREGLDSLLLVFRKSDLYLPGMRGAKKMCLGGFQPGIAVRYLGTSPTTELLLCYKCGEFLIQSRDGPRQGGDFESGDSVFVWFAKAMFPNDPVIQKLETQRATYERITREIHERALGRDHR